MSAETRPPLQGRAFLLTREEETLLAALLRSLGARVHHVPLTQTLPPEDPTPLRQAAAQLSDYSWVALTSARAVEALTSALVDVHGLAAESDTAGPRWACVGQATADALRARLGIEADLVPEDWNAAALAAALLAVERPKRVLFPAAENARPDLPERLRAAGVEVTQVCAYRSAEATPAPGALQPPDGWRAWDGIVLASSLAVTSLWRALTASGEQHAREWLARNHPATLGASAEQALTTLGVPPAYRADRPVAEELVATLIAALAR